MNFKRILFKLVLFEVKTLKLRYQKQQQDKIGNKSI